MTQMETHGEQAERGSAAGIGEMRKPIADFANAQTAFFERFRDANQHWIDRLQSEANLAAEAVSSMTKARSMPEAMVAWQAWNGRLLEMMAQDGRRALSDAQEFIGMNARLLSHDWLSKGRAISS